MSIRVQETSILRAQLSTWLKEQSWCDEVFNSDANFVLFRCQSNELKDFIFNSLVAQGILIRDQSKQQNLANCLRISIGSERELSLLQQTITHSFTTTTAQTVAQEK
jgi:histidinol-phosphate aminotransferase